MSDPRRCQHQPVYETRRPVNGRTDAWIRCTRCYMTTCSFVQEEYDRPINHAWNEWALLMERESAAFHEAADAEAVKNAARETLPVPVVALTREDLDAMLEKSMLRLQEKTLYAIEQGVRHIANDAAGRISSMVGDAINAQLRAAKLL